MFFNGKKKLKMYNDGMKRQVQESLRILQTSELFGTAGALQLETIRSQILNTPSNSSYKVGMIDYKISHYLEDAQLDVQDHSGRVFALRLKKIETMLRARTMEAQKAIDRPKTKEEKKQDKIVAKRNKKLDKKYASNPSAFLAKEVTIDELYSTDDLMLITVSRLQDDVDALQKQVEVLMDKYTDNPEDYSVSYELQQVQSTLAQRRICQQMITAQAVREHSYELFETIAAQDKVKISKRKIEDDQYELLRKKAEEILKKHGISGATVSSGAVAGVAAPAQSVPVQTPAFQSPVIPMTPAMQKKQLEKAKVEMEKLRQQLQDQAQDYADGLPMVERDLLRLLEKRKGCTASQCLVLDMQIDELKVQRNKIIDSVKRVRQNISVLDEQLPIIESAITSGQMRGITDKVGKLVDLSDLAVKVAELTKEGNETLQKSKTDHMVASSVEVDFSSSVSETPDTVTVGEKDENKYADLEAELKRTMGDA